MVQNFPFQSPAPIGALEAFEVNVFTKIAGARTAVGLTITARMRFQVGDNFTLVLSGFGGDSGDCITTTSEPPGAFGVARWTSDSWSLQLVATREIPAFQRVTVLVPSESGVRIPIIGFPRRRSEKLKYFTDASAGPVRSTLVQDDGDDLVYSIELLTGLTPQSLGTGEFEDFTLDIPSWVLESLHNQPLKYPAVGALMSSSATFHIVGSYRGLEGISVSFIPSMLILKGESFSLHLPTFKTGTPNLRFLSYWMSTETSFVIGSIMDSESAVRTLAWWDPDSSMVTMTVPITLSQNRRATVVLPNCPKWQLPDGGIPLNTTVELSTDAFFGPVLPSRVSSVQPPSSNLTLGVFYTVPTVTFCTDFGCNADTNSFLSILASFDIDLGSHVVIRAYNQTSVRNVTVMETSIETYEFTELVNISVVQNITYLENQTTFQNVTVEVITDDVCFGPNITHGQNVTELKVFTRLVNVTVQENSTELQNQTTNMTRVMYRNKTVSENFTQTLYSETMYYDTIRVALPGFNAPSFSELLVSENP
jgi:hypothetical protein